MPNIANIQKLHYCDKKSGNRSSCSNIATRQISMRNRNDKDNAIAKTTHGYRCEEHANSGTVNRSVVESNQLDQSFSMTKINQFLNSLIGKNIVSKFHTARQLRVKYVKPDKSAVMCYQEHSKKWKLVYYEQIKEVL